MTCKKCKHTKTEADFNYKGLGSPIKTQFCKSCISEIRPQLNKFLQKSDRKLYSMIEIQSKYNPNRIVDEIDHTDQENY